VIYLHFQVRPPASWRGRAEIGRAASPATNMIQAKNTKLQSTGEPPTASGSSSFLAPGHAPNRNACLLPLRPQHFFLCSCCLLPLGFHHTTGQQQPLLEEAPSRTLDRRGKPAPLPTSSCQNPMNSR
jgi:hypothetical protein